MATRTTTEPKWPVDPFGEAYRFLVTVKSVVGEVVVDREGTVTAHEAAFMMIARHDTEGDYEFPMANGATCLVHVEHTDPPA